MADFRAVAWRPDGSFALIADDNGNIYKYTPEDDCYEQTHIGSERIDAIAWKDNCNALFAGGNYSTYHDGIVQRYPDYKIIYHGGDDEKYWDVAWRPGANDALVVGESHGKSVALKATLTGATQLSPQGNDYTSVTWKPNGSYALITADAKKIWKYNPADSSFTEVATFPAESGLDNEWKPSGNYTLIVTSIGGVWKYSEDRGLEELSYPPTWQKDTYHRLRAVSWDPCGNKALMCGVFGKVLKFDGTTLSELNSGVNVRLDGVSWRNTSQALIVGFGNTVLRYEDSTGGFYPVSPCN